MKKDKVIHFFLHCDELSETDLFHSVVSYKEIRSTIENKTKKNFQKAFFL